MKLKSLHINTEWDDFYVVLTEIQTTFELGCGQEVLICFVISSSKRT